LKQWFLLSVAGKFEKQTQCLQTRKITNVILAIYIFFKPYSRNFKIFTGLRPAGSIITGRGFCMGLSVLVAEI